MRTGFIAVKGVDKAQVLQRLGEVEGAAPARLWSDPCVGVARDGWVVVVKPDPGFPTPGRLAAVSEGAEAVGYAGCTVVMGTTAWGYRDGRLLWSVEHNGQDDVGHLQASGELPAAFEAAAAAARQEQADGDEQVDYMFDVTENLVFSICGFFPERDFDFAFTALAGAAQPGRGPGLLARLFGAR